MNTMSANLEKLCAILNVELEANEKKKMFHTVITSHQVGTHISASFRIISFRCLVLFSFSCPLVLSIKMNKIGS